MNKPQLILSDYATRETLTREMGADAWTPILYEYFFMAEWDEATGKLLITSWKRYGNIDASHGTTIDAFTLQHAIEGAHKAKAEWRKTTRGLA